jgi:hypothetical protein
MTTAFSQTASTAIGLYLLPVKKTRLKERSVGCEQTLIGTIAG